MALIIKCRDMNGGFADDLLQITTTNNHKLGFRYVGKFPEKSFDLGKPQRISKEISLATKPLR